MNTVLIVVGLMLISFAFGVGFGVQEGERHYRPTDEDDE